jgi:hypothetical protein
VRLGVENIVRKSIDAERCSIVPPANPAAMIVVA